VAPYFAMGMVCLMAFAAYFIYIYIYIYIHNYTYIYVYIYIQERQWRLILRLGWYFS